MNDTQLITAAPSPWRAWVYLIRTSWQRQARAHLMVWIAAGLLLFLALWVALISAREVWDVRTWRMPRRGPGMDYTEWALYTRFAPRSILGHKPPDGTLAPPTRRSDAWREIYARNGPPPLTLVNDPVQLAVA